MINESGRDDPDVQRLFEMQDTGYRIFMQGWFLTVEKERSSVSYRYSEICKRIWKNRNPKCS